MHLHIWAFLSSNNSIYTWITFFQDTVVSFSASIKGFCLNKSIYIYWHSWIIQIIPSLEDTLRARRGVSDGNSLSSKRWGHDFKCLLPVLLHFYCCDKISWPRQLKKESIYLALRFKMTRLYDHHCRNHGSRYTCIAQEQYLRAHIWLTSTRQERESISEMETSESNSSDSSNK